jgi:hypothetical protein
LDAGMIHEVKNTGNVDLFLKTAPFLALNSFSFISTPDWHRVALSDYDVVSGVVMNNRTLTSVVLSAPFDSSDAILKVVEYCRELKTFSFHNRARDVELIRSDFEAISPLPILNILDVDCEIEKGDIFGSIKCKSLGFLALRYYDTSSDLSSFSSIGRTLRGLVLGTVKIESRWMMRIWRLLGMLKRS